MDKKFYLSYLFIFVAILLIMSLSKHAIEEMRGTAGKLIAPAKIQALHHTHTLLHPTVPSPFTHLTSEERIEELTAENHLLLNQIQSLKTLFQERKQIQETIERVHTLKQDTKNTLLIQLDKRDEKELKKLTQRVSAVPARVILRSYDTWNQSLWINLGHAINQPDTPPLIAKNSPVIVGDSIVGLIDYVGKDTSRVRLITDPSLKPSVRVLRVVEGSQQDLLLAKGELQGSPQSLSRQKEPWLKGSGFNYDFADEEGEARELKSGRPILKPHGESMDLIKSNDLLVTTGFDGIFPENFKVAYVSEVLPLKEGDYYYEIKAKPVIPHLDHLQLVFVIRPLVN